MIGNVCEKDAATKLTTLNEVQPQHFYSSHQIFHIINRLNKIYELIKMLIENQTICTNHHNLLNQFTMKLQVILNECKTDKQIKKFQFFHDLTFVTNQVIKVGLTYLKQTIICDYCHEENLSLINNNSERVNKKSIKLDTNWTGDQDNTTNNLMNLLSTITNSNEVIENEKIKNPFISRWNFNLTRKRLCLTVSDNCQFNKQKPGTKLKQSNPITRMSEQSRVNPYLSTTGTDFTNMVKRGVTTIQQPVILQTEKIMLKLNDQYPRPISRRPTLRDLILGSTNSASQRRKENRSFNKTKNNCDGNQHPDEGLSCDMKLPHNSYLAYDAALKHCFLNTSVVPPPNLNPFAH